MERRNENVSTAVPELATDGGGRWTNVVSGCAPGLSALFLKKLAKVPQNETMKIPSSGPV